MLPPYPLGLDFQLRVWDQSLSFNFGHPTHPVSGLRNEKNFLSSFIFNGFFKTSVRLPHLRTSFAEWSRTISEVAFKAFISDQTNSYNEFLIKMYEMSNEIMIIWRMLDKCLTTTWKLSDVCMTIYICFLDSCLITSWQLLDNYLSTDDWHAIAKTCLTTWRLLYQCVS